MISISERTALVLPLYIKMHKKCMRKLNTTIGYNKLDGDTHNTNIYYIHAIWSDIERD